MRGGLRAGALLLALSACAPEGGEEPGATAPLVEFDTSSVRVVTHTDTFAVRVEVAATEDQRAFGLMERESLPEDAGMIFLYREDQPPEAGFWMFHTLVPLDIAYLDVLGQIVAIRQMVPCESPDPRWCDTYPPGVPYRSALEVNHGWLDRHGVSVGDKVLLPEELVAASRR